MYRSPRFRVYAVDRTGRREEIQTCACPYSAAEALRQIAVGLRGGYRCGQLVSSPASWALRHADGAPCREFPADTCPACVEAAAEFWDTPYGRAYLWQAGLRDYLRSRAKALCLSLARRIAPLAEPEKLAVYRWEDGENTAHFVGYVPDLPAGEVLS